MRSKYILLIQLKIGSSVDNATWQRQARFRCIWRRKREGWGRWLIAPQSNMRKTWNGKMFGTATNGGGVQYARSWENCGAGWLSSDDIRPSMSVKCSTTLPRLSDMSLHSSGLLHSGFICIRRRSHRSNECQLVESRIKSNNHAGLRYLASEHAGSAC